MKWSITVSSKLEFCFYSLPKLFCLCTIAHAAVVMLMCHAVVEMVLHCCWMKQIEKALTLLPKGIY